MPDPSPTSDSPTPPTIFEQLQEHRSADRDLACRGQEMSDLLTSLREHPQVLKVNAGREGWLEINGFRVEWIRDAESTPLLDAIRSLLIAWVAAEVAKTEHAVRARLAELAGEPVPAAPELPSQPPSPTEAAQMVKQLDALKPLIGLVRDQVESQKAEVPLLHLAACWDIYALTAGEKTSVEMLGDYLPAGKLSGHPLT